MKAVIVIPARYQSTRFPGKPLAMIAGKSLIHRVYERCLRTQRADRILVATDDERIAEHVLRFGGEVVMTSPDLPSGTDRIAAATRDLDCTQVINVQGDEPLIDIGEVDRMIDVLQREQVEIVTLASAITSETEFRSRDVVKVVVDAQSNALYFSRAPIPHDSWELARRHVGVYGYQRNSLFRFTALPPADLERCESLEQLRALQNGFTIRVLPTPKSHLGVDRPEDVEKVERELAKYES